MKQPIFLSTEQQRQAIIDRDTLERSNDGGIKQFSFHKLRKEDAGFDYPTYDPPKGPLNGERANNWYLDMYYTDGSVVTMAPTKQG